jgi:NAD(P)-dependent dehydrogenase (short-subunit alcohol dehydrogenase family)
VPDHRFRPGPGRGVAGALARRGATVLLSARDPAKAAAATTLLAGEGAGDLRPLPDGLDVADGASVVAAATTIRDSYGHLDVLINNTAAYAYWAETATAADLSQSRAVMDINLYGPWRMIQVMLPLLRATDHPRIVNIASGAGSHGDQQYGLGSRRGAAATYGISKAALLALTTTVAAELEGTPVIVNAVDPGLTATWPGADAMGARPVADSIPGIVWAATLPDNGPRGGFFRDEQPHPLVAGTQHAPFGVISQSRPPACSRPELTTGRECAPRAAAGPIRSSECLRAGCPHSPA